MGNDHDTGYKLLFSHPEMVRDLLTGFVRGDWLREADWSTLTPVPGSYVTARDNPETRQEDLVWKLRLKDRWLYVYLLLEFQSRSDPWMALRMLVYVGLLYQDLVKRDELAPDGKLPPVLPIVLYNGKPRWRGAQSLQELVTPPPAGLEGYVPQARYLLLDEGHHGAEPLMPNLVAALFRLESQRTLEEVRQVVDALADWLSAEAQRPLRRAFAVWIKRLLRQHLPEAALAGINDLQEVRSMLAENIKHWFETYEAKGLVAGRQEGRQEGQALALRRLLTRRFGALPEDLGARIQGARPEDLEAWLDRVLEATRLEEVFQDRQPPPDAR